MDILVGDVQGCDAALGRLLGTLGFSPSRHRLIVLGDLVNRGPGSLQALQRIMRLGASAQTLLGNHDLHLLAAAQGVRRPSRLDTLSDILAHPERDAMLDWMRQRPLAMQASGWLLIHAGLPPAWDTPTTLALAAEVEAVLRGPGLGDFLREMYGDRPARWDPALQGSERLRAIVNALTRMRFCTADGTQDFETKDSADAAPPGFMPWFDVPGRASAGQRVAFGHWSTLGVLRRPDLLALDSGCVWGGKLTAALLKPGGPELVQVRCPQAQAPGMPREVSAPVR